MKFLISSIIRNREHYLYTWYNQLKETVDSNPDHQFYLSVFENDSTDNSFDLLKSFNFSFFDGVQILNQKLKTRMYGSVVDSERVMLLATYRNKTLKTELLNNCDFVICIEPDIKYNVQDTNKIINNHDYDILSAASTHKNNIFYDTWATRPDDKCDRFYLDLNQGICKLWSTYSCYCKYNAEPIKKGINFGGFNKRLNKFDCDTAVICENFRENGYNKIAADTSIKVYHY
ncbi:MAG: Cryptococcal mannosyltransferase 1 [Bacteroidota bacterium]|jgi:hypothetical protein